MQKNRNLVPYFFSQRTVFFSHNKAANSTFSHGLSAKRTGHWNFFFCPRMHPKYWKANYCCTATCDLSPLREEQNFLELSFKTREWSLDFSWHL